MTEKYYYAYCAWKVKTGKTVLLERGGFGEQQVWGKKWQIHRERDDAASPLNPQVNVFLLALWFGVSVSRICINGMCRVIIS